MAREQTLIVDAEMEVVADKSKKKWIQISVVIAIVVVVVQKLSGNPKYVKFSTVLKIVMGTIILLIGFYMFYLGF